MPSIPTLPEVTSRLVDTDRLQVHVLEAGPPQGTPVLFVHGNASSSTFWESTLLALPGCYRGFAPDLRGYGDTEDLLVDATRGVGDWVDDLIGLLDGLGLDQVHVVGHSLGGTVVLGLLAAAPERFHTVTLVAPGSPYGFGGSRADGTPVFSDGAGGGAGVVNPDFPRLIAEGDRSEDNPQGSPRVVMNSFYWKPPFRPEREEALLSSVLSEKIGPKRYPGDARPSENWPGTAPGDFGPVNAISARHAGDLAERVVSASPKPPVLWVRGDSDQIVSDASLFDIAVLGGMGLIPGYPGAEVFPPQPMVGQMRDVLERYREAGGRFEEVVVPDAGHTPYVEKPDAFAEVFHPHLARS